MKQLIRRFCEVSRIQESVSTQSGASLSPRSNLGGMMQRFDALQQLVLGQRVDPSDPELDDPLFRRISRTLQKLHAAQGNVGKSDIAVLIRQALLSCGTEFPGSLRVPLSSGWPDDATWRRFGCEASTAGIGFTYLVA